MLREGNFTESAFGGDGYVGLDVVEISFEEPSGADSLGVNRIFINSLLVQVSLQPSVASFVRTTCLLFGLVHIPLTQLSTYSLTPVLPRLTTRPLELALIFGGI